jgi:hypothetical protein
MTITTGSWLADCGLDLRGYRNWWVEIAIETESDSDSVLELSVYPEEWGFRLRHGTRLSNIRFTTSSCDIGRDDLGILDEVADLSTPSALFVLLEQRFGLALRRHTANVRSNLPEAPKLVRSWLLYIQ